MLSFIHFKRKSLKLFFKITNNTKYSLLDDTNENDTARDIPKVPIKTYQWEDVRRSRKRGAYPWTHLTKPPFDEEVDPEEYTMDAFRRSRSTSTIGKSETQEISEVEEDMEVTEETKKPVQQHNGVPEGKEKISPVKSEEPSTSKEAAKPVQLAPPQKNAKDSRAKSEEPKKKRKLSIQSSVSRISLSKLGLMDKFKDAKAKLKVPKLPKRSKSDASELKQPKKQKTVSAKPAPETAKGSWMPSLPDESPVYIHIPLKPAPGQTDEFSKYEFDSGPSSHSGSLTQLPQAGQRKLSLLGILTELKRVHELQKLASETAAAKKSGSSELAGTSTAKQAAKVHPDHQVKTKSEVKPSQKLKPDDKLKMEVAHDDETEEPIVELVESIDSVSSEPKKLDVGKARVQRKESDRLVIEEITDEDRKSNKSVEDSKPESERSHKPRTPEPMVIEPEDSSADDNISQYLDKDDKCEIASERSTNVSSESVSKAAGPSKVEEAKPQTTPEVSKPDAEKVRKLEATLSKWKKQLPPISTLQASAKETERPVRAKSEEPKRKRRSSIDSSYSRKSLSKLAFMKKIKEAKDKIKLPKFPSFTKTDKKDSKKPKTEKRDEEKPKKSDAKQKETKKDLRKQPETPVYIHIPLKLPPGETDEFSYLADEGNEKIAQFEEPKPEKKEGESSVPTSPDTPTNDVQLIILTPPSDDEILDSSIPETPIGNEQRSLEITKIAELKTLAKNAIDTVYPEPKKLETVNEDEGSDEQENKSEKTEKFKDKKQGDTEEDVSEKKVLSQKEQQILVDEEDGLKLSEAAIAMINEELAKEMHELEQKEKTASPPALRKKVSFKRKSKAEDGERIYEDVELSSDPTKAGTTEDKKGQSEKLKPLEIFQSMSVDEEKSYLDKKVIKDTSLEEDYNKWSKLNDHEYEPVNPPPEEMTAKGPPAVRVADMGPAGNEMENGTTPLEGHFLRIPADEELVVHDEDGVMDEQEEHLDAQEVQRRIEDRFFNTTPEATRADADFTTSQVDSSAPEASAAKKQSNKEGPAKSFNDTLRAQAVKIKSKLQGIKKPSITLPQRPKLPSTKLKKPNFKKPSFTMPKMPAKPSIHLPSFSLTRKDSSKDSWKERQLSTESNAGDSKKKLFDFSTYPRIFDRSRKNKEKESSPSKERDPTPPPPEFATVPRVNRKKGPVGSRWANKFKDIKYVDEDARRSKEFDDEETQDVIKIPLHPDNEDPMDVPSHTRYNEDIDIDDDFDRENRDIHRASPFSKDYLKRWNHGEFHEGPLPHQLHYGQEMDHGAYRITDLDNDMEETLTPPGGSFEMEIPKTKEQHSSGSLSEHRRGVLEEIDSDEFFLREKGISQENIEVGKYLSSEIREAFRNPINALSQLQGEDREYDLDISDQSESLQDLPRRKPLRKPRRKKTPHTSKEQIDYEQESEPEEYPTRFDKFQTFIPPARPKRKSKKSKKKKPATADIVPYQETIPIEEQLQSFGPVEPELEIVQRSEILPGNILGNNHQVFYDKGYLQMYENEHMRGIEQPEIKVSDPYYRYENFHQDVNRFLQSNINGNAPTAPARKHKSLKSLDASEPDSIAEEINIPKEIPQQDVEAYRAEQEYIIPTPEPPARPKRMQSRTQSQSGASQQEDDRTSRGADSLISDNQVEVVEEPCVQDIRDASGYAVIDKSKIRDPPLPPSRFASTPPRARRNKRSPKADTKFSTAPRPVPEIPPIRPLRNYSTLGGPSRLSRSISTPSPSNIEHEKENIDISQYIEIENDEPTHRLQSGEVIQKMRDRPLPAPPRPPRRPRGAAREVLRDISHERNLPPESQSFEKGNEISPQIEAEEFLSGDRMSPGTEALLHEIEPQILPYDHEETVTHAALVVQPIDNAHILPHSQIWNFEQRVPGQPPIEQTITVTQEYPVNVPSATPDQKTYDEEETSEIPEDFKKLKNPMTLKPTPPQEGQIQQLQQQQPIAPLQDNQEVGVLKAQKLQVLDLDVDKLRVNELQASKIVVSELDGVSLQVSEISSKSGNLVVSGIELPPHLIQEMLDRLQIAAHDQPSTTQQCSESIQTIKPENTTKPSEHTVQQTEIIVQQPSESKDQGGEPEQKKTSIAEVPLETNEVEAPPVPPRYDSKTDLLNESLEESKEPETELPCDIPISQENQECPIRPPRRSSQTEKSSQNLEESDTPEFQNQSLNSLQVPQGLKDTITEVPVYANLQPESSDTMPQADNTSRSEEEPPPRPPQPQTQQDSEYIPSQPPASFFALRSPQYAEFIEEDIPLPPRRKRHHKAPPVSRSSSDDVAPAPRRHPRSPEPSIPHLTGQLVRACATEADRSIKRLISHITNNMFQNADGKQDLHVMILMLLILIAGLILLSGDERVTIHHHHWEFFNPPRDL